MWLGTLVVLGGLALPAVGWAPAAQAARAPQLAPGDVVIDGPDAGITALSGMSIARDGTGGLVYVKTVGGVRHVFVSVLAGGSFQAPVQVDAGLAAGSSQPVIAAGNGGTLLVGFINSGVLYAAQRVGGGAFAAPAALYSGAANPSISMSNFGKAYLAFTATNGAGGGDVRTAYYYGGAWGLEPSALDNNPADAAGTGAGAPQVATAGDGDGIVAWGENGHIFTRRVVKTTASVVDEEADVPSLAGWQEVSADDPQIATGGDDTYASVAFQERFASGASQQSRVLTNRLHGSLFDGIQQADGVLMGGPEGADRPQTSDTEYGTGWVVSEHDASHALFATTLGSNDSFGATERIDSLPNSAAPDAVSSNAGLISTFITWQQDPGVSGPAEIRLRYAPNGTDLGPEQVISNPAYGATDAAAGLAGAGDVAGDAAVAWVQGSGANTRILTAQLYQPPGGFSPSNAFRYAATRQPALFWSPSSESWGAPVYQVRVDGVVVGQTTATALTTPPLRDGRHTYQVASINQAGVYTTDRAATILVDTLHPQGSLKLTGTRQVRKTLHLTVKDSDKPPAGLPKNAASGVSKVTLSWGDGSKLVTVRRSPTTTTHAYKRKRTYTIVLTVTDRAGNRTVVRQKVKITTPSKPKKKKKGKGKAKKAPRHQARAARTQGARLTINPVSRRP